MSGADVGVGSVGCFGDTGNRLDGPNLPTAQRRGIRAAEAAAFQEQMYNGPRVFYAATLG